MSTQFTTGPIETLNDWNAVLENRCCCQMPWCPGPSIEKQTIIAAYGAQYVHPNPYEIEVNGYYLALTSNYWWVEWGGEGEEDIVHDEDSYTEGPIRSWELLNGPCGEQDREWDDFPSYTAYAMEMGWMPDIGLNDERGSIDEVYDVSVSDPWNGTQFLSDIRQHFNRYSFDNLDCELESEIDHEGNPMSYMGGDSLIGSNNAAGAGRVELGRCRFRFRLEYNNSSYFKITYDIYSVPPGYDPWNPESPRPVPVETDITIMLQRSGELWLSDWKELQMPETPGRVQVFNIRYENYVSPYGHLPQTMGEPYEPS